MSDTLNNPTIKRSPQELRGSVTDEVLKAPSDATGAAAYREIRSIPRAEDTLVVTSLDGLQAAIAAAEPHITVSGIIPMTAKVTIPASTTVKVRNGSGFDCQGSRDILEFNGRLDAGEHQVFYNTVPYERDTAAFNITALSSIWGTFNYTRNAIWWGPELFGGTQTDQNALQCAVDSAVLTPLVTTVSAGAYPFIVDVPQKAPGWNLTDTLWLQSTRVHLRGEHFTQLNFDIDLALGRTACIDFSAATDNNGQNVRIDGFRITDFGARNGTNTTLTCIVGQTMEEHTKIINTRIVDYGTIGIHLVRGANTGEIKHVEINRGNSAQPIGMLLDGVNGSLSVRNCAVVNANTYIAYWVKRAGGNGVTFQNCHEENSNIGFLIGPDPATSPSTAERDTTPPVTIQDCSTNTKQNGETGIYITSGNAIVNITNHRNLNSNAGSNVLFDQVVNGNDPNMPLLNTGGFSGISQYRRYPKINGAAGYVRRSDGTTGGLPATFGGWRIHWVLDTFGL